MPGLAQGVSLCLLEISAMCRDSCATSSAWMNAVPGFLDKVDTYPGLSSDMAAQNPLFDEDRVSC